MNVNERNKRIKKVLSQEFGYKNVRVRGDRGTAYGWVDIFIYVDLPKGEDNSKERWDKIKEITEKVKDILKENKLWEELYEYWSDFGFPEKEIIIQINDKNENT